MVCHEETCFGLEFVKIQNAFFREVLRPGITIELVQLLWDTERSLKIRALSPFIIRAEPCFANNTYRTVSQIVCNSS